MAFRTRTKYINDLFVSTYAEAIGSVRDQIFDSKNSAFWAILRAKGGMMSQLGGDKIRFNLEYGTNDQLYWLKKGGEVNLQDFEHLEQAEYNWHYVDKPVVRFWQDDQQNPGEAEILDMIKSKINNSMKTYGEELDTALFSANDESGGTTANAIPGLQHLVSEAGTGTVGGIVAGTYTWWKNKFLDYDSGTDYVETAGSPSDADWLNTGVTAMRYMIKECRDNVDLIICPWHIFSLMQDDLLTYFQWDGRLAADLGLPTNTPMFDGIPVMWSQTLSDDKDGSMFFLDMDSIKFIYDPRYFLSLGPWLPLPKQPNDLVAHITLACSFIIKDRRNCGVIHGLPTSAS